jgi:HEAT repeat protein
MSSTDTRFKPGQSGNPGGRKPLPEELKARLRDLSPKAVDALEQALESADDRVRISAATALLDRAYGKPQQQTDVNMNVDAAQAHLAALVALARKRDTRDVNAGPT